MQTVRQKRDGCKSAAAIVRACGLSVTPGKHRVADVTLLILATAIAKGSPPAASRAIVLTNQKGAVLELSGRQVGLMANADLSGLAITLK